MSEVTQIVNLSLNLSVWLSARSVKDDYGVPNSTFWTIEDHDWQTYEVEIGGAMFDVRELPEKLQDIILEAAIEAADEGEWE